MRAHSNKQAFVTISVDDGYPSDLRAAELLNKYGLAATFYVPAHNPEQPVLTPEQVRQLSKRFEIGGHTMNHLPLNTLSDEQASQEIVEGKQWMEDLIGERVLAFCYPRGKFGQRVAGLVRKAGFVGARTCCLNLHGYTDDPFMWGVSTQAHNHTKGIQLRHAMLERNFQGMFNFLTTYKSATDWAIHFEHALDHVQIRGGVAHLYLHSWEIDERNDWQKLDSVFRSISERKSLRRVTNGELFAMCTARNYSMDSERDLAVNETAAAQSHKVQSDSSIQSPSI